MRLILQYILMLSLIASLASCNDEEVFNLNSKAVLTFSSDTISFDTVFSTIGTSTKNFQVYNRNNENLRLSSVRLASGGTSGFRINVDGQYGVSHSDVDILRNDSIFIFVEVTVHPQEADSPILVEDSIIFTTASGLRQQVMLRAYGQDIIVLKGMTIDSDTTLCSPRPYVIYDSLVVNEGATLHIGAGSTLCFHPEAGLTVRGTLDIQGTYEQPVTLRGDRTDKMFPYLPYDRLASQWQGVRFTSSSTGNTINCADIHSGTFGIRCDATADSIRQLTLTNSTIHNVAGYGLAAVNSNIYVANCQISNSMLDCISLLGGTYDFYHCTIAQFYPWKADRGNAVVCSNADGRQAFPLHRMRFFNSIITGYATDEIFATRMQDTDSTRLADSEFNLLFDYCLVNTDTTDASQYFTNCLIDHKDSLINRAGNFKTIDTDIYLYDFSLDSLSRARSAASPSYTSLFPLNKNGQKREEKSNMGCY